MRYNLETTVKLKAVYSIAMNANNTATATLKKVSNQQRVFRDLLKRVVKI
jgi:hypothetical protein